MSRPRRRRTFLKTPAHESRSITEAVGKLFQLMNKGERRRFYLLMPAVTVMALMQVIGSASVLPFLALVTDPTLVQSNEYLAFAYDRLGFQSTNAFLVFAGLVALVVLVLSNALIAFTEYLLLRFSWNLNHTLSVRMLREYLSKPYVFFLDQNTTG